MYSLRLIVKRNVAHTIDDTMQTKMASILSLLNRCYLLLFLLSLCQLKSFTAHILTLWWPCKGEEALWGAGGGRSWGGGVGAYPVDRQMIFTRIRPDCSTKRSLNVEWRRGVCSTQCVRKYCLHEVIITMYETGRDRWTTITHQAPHCATASNLFHTTDTIHRTWTCKGGCVFDPFFLHRVLYYYLFIYLFIYSFIYLLIDWFIYGTDYTS